MTRPNTFVSCLAVGLALVSSACAGFNVTSLTITTYPNGAAVLHNSLAFTVRDLDPATLSQANCSTSWPANADPSTDYVKCDPSVSTANATDTSDISSFTWRFGDSEGTVPTYKDAEDFGLEVAHGYKDDALGPPPYNHVSTFGHAAINETHLDCKTEKLGGWLDQSQCQLKPGVVVNMPIFSQA